MEARLNGRGILGSRDTAPTFRIANLDDMGFTEYDVMVGRCRDKFFQRYVGAGDSRDKPKDRHALK